MSQNRQTHFKNLAANAARFLKCVWPFGTLCIKGLTQKSGDCLGLVEKRLSGVYLMCLKST